MDLNHTIRNFTYLLIRVTRRLFKKKLGYHELFYICLYHILMKLRLTDRALNILENRLVAVVPQARYGEVAARLALFYEQAMEFEKSIKYWRFAQCVSADWNGMFCQALLKDPDATNASLLDAHRHWASKWISGNTNISKGGNGKALKVVDEAGSRPMRIGFSCSFWHTSTIRFQFLSWVGQLDKSKFNLFFYVGAHIVPQYLERYADFIRRTPKTKVSDAEFAAMVQKDQIDILVELNGYSHGHRFAAMASRCAPVQVSYLNHTATCGVPNVDYVIADDICVPAEDPYYTERVYRLPRCFFCFNFEEEDMPISKEPPILKNGFVTFGFFGGTSKFNKSFIQLMVAVLQASEGSRLLMANNGLSYTEHRANLVKRFADLGIHPSRLLLFPGRDRHGVAELHKQVDITFDSWPYCGGNTLAESLWYGVPAITLKGNRFSSRYGASILSAAGLPDLVASSEDEYVQLSATLSSDISRLEDLRLNLRRMMCSEGMFSDTAAFARDMAHGFEEMYRQTAEDNRHRPI